MLLRRFNFFNKFTTKIFLTSFQQQQQRLFMSSNAASLGVDLTANKDEIIDSVKNYYGKVLTTTKDLKSCGCVPSSAPPPAVRAALKNVPLRVTEKFYGCGYPIHFNIEGLTILDLGCGSGQDCFVAAQLAGKTGKIIGIDMTEEQIAVAKQAVPEFAEKCPDAAPLVFARGYIEDVLAAENNAVQPNSIDIVISNCVVNLSADKKAVLLSVYKALKNGGEFYFSDVYCDRRLPENIRKHELLFGECLGGALFLDDFITLAKKCGFRDVRQVKASPVDVNDPDLARLCGAAKFVSITFRLFKFDNEEIFEETQQDFGQIAILKDTTLENSFLYRLDDQHTFEINRPMMVSGNTATILQQGWLKNHFVVIGDRTNHFGSFYSCQQSQCGGDTTTAAASQEEQSSCQGGGCCG